MPSSIDPSRNMAPPYTANTQSTPTHTNVYVQEQAKKDLARLAEVRARREAAAKKRDEELRRASFFL